MCIELWKTLYVRREAVYGVAGYSVCGGRSTVYLSGVLCIWCGIRCILGRRILCISSGVLYILCICGGELLCIYGGDGYYVFEAEYCI